jgi:hypothetical protein
MPCLTGSAKLLLALGEYNGNLVIVLLSVSQTDEYLAWDIKSGWC